jgi:hypothetical protein
VVPVQPTNIPPTEMVTYTKQTQTAATGPERDGKHQIFVFTSGYQHFVKIYTTFKLVSSICKHI